MVFNSDVHQFIVTAKKKMAPNPIINNQVIYFNNTLLICINNQRGTIFGVTFSEQPFFYWDSPTSLLQNVNF